eukprot:CAMPEP_0198596338 /NCGR_PEP_ID=MMETSP1462-20131121/143043_1 /TAXON_ID=1333877 /ORGANISM="Brandtodinium nutriculum, Strain RCC3387" /LENGTH=124 /DNA_ID=CAMNT_0044327975 /DNA_START=93 /DNA_END=467 /DNA_ORIENTATION=-
MRTTSAGTTYAFGSLQAATVRNPLFRRAGNAEWPCNMDLRLRTLSWRNSPRALELGTADNSRNLRVRLETKRIGRGVVCIPHTDLARDKAEELSPRPSPKRQRLVRCAVGEPTQLPYSQARRGP